MPVRRYEPPKVVRQEVHWVPESRVIPLPEEPYRVWTLYGPGREDKDTPPSLPITPFHNHGAFLEDHVHDWNWERGKLRYYSRVLEHSTWILVEYMTPKK